MPFHHGVIEEDMLSSRVRCYRNLNNGGKENMDISSKSFDRQSLPHVYGKVIAHAHGFLLHDVIFTVSEAGRQRVIEEKKKNVHAFVQGLVTTVFETDSSINAEVFESIGAQSGAGVMVSYNPYKGPNFFIKDNNKPVDAADKALVTPDGVWVLWPRYQGKLCVDAISIANQYDQL